MVTRWLGVAVAAVVLWIGSAAVSGRLIPPRFALIGVALAQLLGLIATIGAAVAAWQGGGLPAIVAVALGLAAFVPGVISYARAAGLPRVNDVTTDLEDPPAFRALLEDPRFQGRKLSYPRSFVEPVRAAYSDVQPVRLDLPPDEAIERARDVAVGQGWRITEVYGDGFEAYETTPLLQFRDDVVVRVRADGEGSRIDARSRSQDGGFDFGVNASRLREYLAALKTKVHP